MEIENELYREIVLDHYKSPRNYGPLDNPDLSEAGANPLCGDELTLMLKFKDNILTDIRFGGKGCSISHASASMMTEAVKGKSFPEIQKIISAFKGLMLEGKSAEGLPAELEEANSLEGVRKYPVRIKCALLAWNTLLQALKKYSP